MSRKVSRKESKISAASTQAVIMEQAAKKSKKKRMAAKPEKQHIKTTRRTRKLKMSSGAFIAPSLIGVLLFFILPFIVIIWYSMVDNPVSANFVFLDNFKSIVANPAFQRAVRNTFMFSLVSVPLAVVLSLILAIVLESKIPFKSQFRTFFLSPMMVPVASIVLIWQVLFHYNGAVNELLGHFGVDKIDWMKSKYALVVVAILFLWKNLGYNMILFMAALASIPKDILEVATLESATPFQTFFHIKIRYLSSTLLFVTIMSLISSFKIFREVYLLTGDYPTDTVYMLQHFMNNKFRNLDYQTLSAAAILMSLVMIVIIGLLFIVEDRFGKDVEG
ncbi:MAG: sugar ABC transporter permease [Butyrivibrio sp.]|nr:sugar ABC transporter permease [Acetatifactor muris]MCM1558164.1 sugar ABC transporter permease [Butyrivibrio sp.]